MQEWLFASGVLLLILCAVDLLWTVLFVGGGQGFLTSRLTSWSWRALKAVVPPDRRRLLSAAGPVVMLLTIGTWIILLWAGWILIFASEPGAIRHAQDAREPDLTALVYYVGYTLFTLGMGDWVPVGGTWQLATAVATGTGMLLITLLITYVISVIGAVVQKRAFASHVDGLGPTPAGFLESAWTGRDFQGLELQIQDLTTKLGVMTEQHFAYPILHYYHASSPSRSGALAVAKLDEGLFILSVAVPAGARPPPGIIHAGRSAVGTYLEALQGAFISPAKQPPPPPDLHVLRKASVPLDSDALEDAVPAHERRRRLLLGAVKNDGWAWEDLQKRVS